MDEPFGMIYFLHALLNLVFYSTLRNATNRQYLLAMLFLETDTKEKKTNTQNAV